MPLPRHGDSVGGLGGELLAQPVNQLEQTVYTYVLHGRFVDWPYCTARSHVRRGRLCAKNRLDVDMTICRSFFTTSARGEEHLSIYGTCSH